MVEHLSRNPYLQAKYEQGVDAKIVVMGNTGVGKTSLLYRYTQNKFEPKNTTSTTGALFISKKLYVNGIRIRLQLWDTAGQERFRSMAPMYYRGAHAALLMYDITNAASFEDIRGWLEELKSNCSPDLIIYIVGSKADLHRRRQVTSDLARLSLHRWFPPPRPPTPPPPPPPSTFAYMRPRFTSFTSMRGVPISFPVKQPLTPSAETDDGHDSRSSGVTRSTTSAGYTRPRAKSGGDLLQRANTTGMIPRHTPNTTWKTPGDASSTSQLAEDDDPDDTDDQEWGLEKGMELFEVSAKDDIGVQQLFDSLLAAIIKRKDAIEAENELKKRDSVYLTPATTPVWAAQADAEEKAQATVASASWRCCSV